MLSSVKHFGQQEEDELSDDSNSSDSFPKKTITENIEYIKSRDLDVVY